MAENDPNRMSGGNSEIDPLISNASRLLGMDQWSVVTQIPKDDVRDPSSVPALAVLDPGELVLPPTRLDACETTWSCDLRGLSNKQKSQLFAKPYGREVGELQPLIFQERGAMGCLMLQMKGGTGRTTHALNLAATAAIDGSRLWTRVLLWECLRQTGLRPFLSPRRISDDTNPLERHMDATRIKIRMSENIKDEAGINVVLAPNRMDDSLSAKEAEQLYRSLRRSTHVITVDAGPVDLRGGGAGAELLRGLLLQESLYAVIPWTPNLASWYDAKEIVTHLREIGVPANRLWGITLQEPTPKRPLGPSESEALEVFEGQMATIPYVPWVLERSMAERTLPITGASELRAPYRELLERMLADWLHG
jgi:hypothetical protein